MQPPAVAFWKSNKEHEDVEAPNPKRLPAAQDFGRRGFAQAGQISNKFQFFNSEI
jgi:hypothetical protein